MNFASTANPLLFWAAWNKPELVYLLLEKGCSLYAAQNLEDVKILKAVIRDAGIPDRNVRWGVALRRLEERFRKN